MKKFLIRTISALVFLAIMLSAIFVGSNLLFIVMAAFLGIALYELKNFVPFKPIESGIYILLGIIFYFISIYGSQHFTYQQWAAVIVLYSVSIFCISLMQKNFTSKVTSFKMFALFYFTIPFILYVKMFDMSEMVGMPHYFLPLCVIGFIWIGDTFAYLVGSLIGKHKMAPKISPKKSWEGFFGGLFFTALTSLLLAYYTNIEIETNKYIFWILLSTITYLSGTLGDLLESSLKRTAEIKDSGKIMPGHGGFFDRFDSFILAVPCVTIFLLTILF